MKAQQIVCPKNLVSAHTHTQKTTQLGHNLIRLSLKTSWNVRSPQLGARRNGYLTKIQSYLHLIPPNLSHWALVLSSSSSVACMWAGKMLSAIKDVVKSHIQRDFLDILYYVAQMYHQPDPDTFPLYDISKMIKIFKSRFKIVEWAKTKVKQWLDTAKPLCRTKLWSHFKTVFQHSSFSSLWPIHPQSDSKCSPNKILHIIIFFYH